jgi:hypothetical protein
VQPTGSTKNFIYPWGIRADVEAEEFVPHDSHGEYASCEAVAVPINDEVVSLTIKQDGLSMTIVWRPLLVPDELPHCIT